MPAMTPAPHGSPTTLDRNEVARFAKLARRMVGRQRPVQAAAPHQSHPPHLYSRPALPEIRARQARRPQSLERLYACSISAAAAGLVCEPLARLGARVTGIDPAEEAIEAAKAHAHGRAARHRLSGGDRRGAGRGEARASTPCCCSKWSSTCPTCRAPDQGHRAAGEARRHHDPLHPQPHAQGLCACHRRRRTTSCAGSRSAPINGTASSRPDELQSRAERRRPQASPTRRA